MHGGTRELFEFTAQKDSESKRILYNIVPSRPMQDVIEEIFGINGHWALMDYYLNQGREPYIKIGKDEFYIEDKTSGRVVAKGEDSEYEPPGLYIEKENKRWRFPR